MNENRGKLPPPRRRQGFLRAAGLALLLLASTAPAGPDEAPERNSRYLFIVDASFSMARIKAPTQQAIFDLLDGGVAGWMRDGDTYGLWTFGSRVNTDFPMRTWDAKQKKSLAALAWDHVRKQRFEKQGPFASVLADMLAVVRSAQDVTVLILTDGDEPLKGTRFDAEVNRAMDKVAPKLHAAKQPVILALVARGGQLVWWGVNSPEQFLPLPKAPPTTPSTVATAKTTPSPHTNAVATTSSLPALAKPTTEGAAPSLPETVAVPTNHPSALPKPAKLPRESIIITRESIGMKPAPPPPDPVPVIADVKPAEATNPPPVVVSTNPAPVVVPANPPPAKPLAPALVEAPPPVTPSATSSAVTIQKPKLVEAVTPVSEKLGERPPPWKWLALGATACAASVLATLVWWRRRNRVDEPSLITRSMARNGAVSSSGSSRQDRPSAGPQKA